MNAKDDMYVLWIRDERGEPRPVKTGYGMWWRLAHALLPCRVSLHYGPSYVKRLKEGTPFV